VTSIGSPSPPLPSPPLRVSLCVIVRKERGQTSHLEGRGGGQTFAQFASEYMKVTYQLGPVPMPDVAEQVSRGHARIQDPQKIAFFAIKKRH